MGERKKRFLLHLSSPSLASLDEKQSILIFRWLLVFVLVALMVFGTRGLRFASAGYYLAIAIFVSNLGLLAIPRRRFRSAAMLNIIFLADTVFVTAAIYFSSGFRSDLYLIYFLVIFIAAAAGRHAWGSMLTGAVASILYGWQVFSSSGAAALTEGAFLIRIPFLFVIAATSSLLARQARLRRKEQERQQRFIKDLQHQVEVATMVGEKATRDARTMDRHRESILSSMTSGVIIVDGSGSITNFNKAAEQTTGLEPGRVLGRPFTQVGLPSPLAEILVDAHSSHRLSFGKEAEIVREGEPAIQLGITTSLVKEEGDGPCGIIAIFKDITATRYLEKRVREAQQLAILGEMAACVAHEIRNPLNSINGFAQLIRQKSSEDDKRREYAEVVLREAERIDRIIEDILGFARKRVPDFRATDINGLLDDVGRAVREKSEKNGVSIEFLFASGLPPIEVDGNQMREVFFNLLHNAIDASEGGTTVEVSTGIDDQWLTIEVADQGCGMSEEVRERIFEPFFTTKERGTGLGLVVSRRIVEGHGGTVAVASEEGRGTRFTIKIPRKDGGYREHRETEPAAVAQTQGIDSQC
ncbi:hypothetical protein AMJ39_01065 [candidate division TA06 bacterium DG_24]|uniref:histidine kinase n=3 Tax=Bacteria division TA06 TaxID=1156500 RepID=A0A0S8JN54_UNCT6|nr:MAG: hypothetical protein AMJ39_01065 [candidate division TA06 bacterium DG_24]KPK71660.1 MAG: hypothetical protein AMJ82_00100 [candidate division TA06 bacterium SM23_40]KPL10155.1 MAG: hypothetical protein AMJ71_04175 [candidate division TA06 bacterium SM1_40]